MRDLWVGLGGAVQWLGIFSGILLIWTGHPLLAALPMGLGPVGMFVLLAAILAGGRDKSRVNRSITAYLVGCALGGVLPTLAAFVVLGMGGRAWLLLGGLGLFTALAFWMSRITARPPHTESL